MSSQFKASSASNIFLRMSSIVFCLKDGFKNVLKILLFVGSIGFNSAGSAQVSRCHGSSGSAFPATALDRWQKMSRYG